MWTVTKSTKRCATCAKWRGEREETKTTVVVKDTMTYGKCGAESSPKEYHACEGHTCAKYVPF